MRILFLYVKSLSGHPENLMADYKKIKTARSEFWAPPAFLFFLLNYRIWFERSECLFGLFVTLKGKEF